MMYVQKNGFFPDDLYSYLVEHGLPPDDILTGLIETTRRLGEVAIMQISPDQGAFMTLLTKMINARQALEIGTFTGYSALCIARGLPPEGRLLCCDTSEEWTAIGRSYWELAGVASKIDLRIGPAIETLRSLPKTRVLDLAFIDADKENQRNYYEELLIRMRPGGVVLVDNALAFGMAANPSVNDRKVRAVREFNQFVSKDPRVEGVMLPIADGLFLLRVV